MRIAVPGGASAHGVRWHRGGRRLAVRARHSLALVLLMPLKRVEPFVVRVDNAPAVVDVVPVYTGAGAHLEHAVTRYLLTHYITVCERFNYATAESDYEECGAFHTAQRNQAWYALWNPQQSRLAPERLQGRQHGARAGESVSFFKRASGVADLAQVRYLKAKRRRRRYRRERHALDRDAPVRLRGSVAGSQGPRLESARVQDRGFHAGA